MPAFAEQRGVELESDQEHIKDDADLRDDVEERPYRRGEKIAFGTGRETAEQRRTQHDPSDDFADYRRLTGAAKDPAHRARGRDDDDQREEHMQQVALTRA